MRSTKVSFRIPNPLLELFVEDCDDKDMKNLGRWFQSLGIDRVMFKRRMALYDFIARATPPQQDALLALLKSFPADPAQMADLLVNSDSAARAKVVGKQRAAEQALMS